jgi:hypothetical protein
LIGSLETDEANPGLWHSPPLHAAAGRTREDWAETWAHYLHMIDTLEMAAACWMSLWPERQDEPTLQALHTATAPALMPFDRLIRDWFSITYVMNNLNRGLGMADAYPFVYPRRRSTSFVSSMP